MPEELENVPGAMNHPVLSVPNNLKDCDSLVKKCRDVENGGNFVHIEVNFPPDCGRVVQAIAAGPVIVSDGEVIEEDFFSAPSMGKEFRAGECAPTRFPHMVSDPESAAPRSAVGIMEDGGILLVTVDDDREFQLSPEERYSVGATLKDLAELMLDLGARDALNLDGGGSTCIFFDGEIRNRPSDGTPRLISTAILVGFRSPSGTPA